MNKCVLPFINHDYQTNSPCCILKNYNNTENLSELIDDHIKNKKSKFCEACWKSEEVGIRSKRQNYNKIHGKYITQIDRDVKISVIPVGNVCNLSCVTCGPGVSTGWIKKHKFINGTTGRLHVSEKIKNEHVNNLEKLHHVEFIGGETLQSKSLWQYLETMNKNISFSLQTNGSIILDKNQIELLQTFNQFNICFSVDGYKKIFEYLRQPADWQKTVTNITKYKNYFGPNRLSYYLTISNLNIFYIDSIMIELFKVLPAYIDINFVHHPTCFAYDNHTLQNGEIIVKNNPGFFKGRKIKWQGTEKSIRYALENLKKQDEFSGLKIEQCLPETFNLFMNSL